VVVSAPAVEAVQAADVINPAVCTITITRGRLFAALKSVAPFMSDDPTRPHLASVLVELRSAPPALRLVASDGHTLARVTVPVVGLERADAMPRGTLLAAADVKALIKALVHTRKTATQAVAITVAGRSIEVRVEGATHRYTAMDAQFPPYEQVVPPLAPRGTNAVGINPRYLARACDAIAALGRTPASVEAAVVVFGSGELDPVTVRYAEELVGEFLGVIMPMRV